MLNGFQETCVLLAALKTGLVEQLSQGPVEPSRLPIQEPLRFLRVLENLGLVACEDSKWRLTARGQQLDHPEARAWARLIEGEYLPVWSRLSDSLSSGRPAFPLVFGQSAWQHRGDHPDLNQAFQTVMRGEQARTLTGLTRVFDFAGVRCVADVGGGEGGMLAGLLSRYEHLHGILYDQPHVVDGLDLGPRCRVVAGSFFDSVPVGADLYLLKHVLHNWDDAACLTLLGHCRRALGEGGRLLVLENLQASPLMDMHMLVVLGGRERSLAQYQELLAGAGLRLVNHRALRKGSPDLLEVVAA